MAYWVTLTKKRSAERFCVQTMKYYPLFLRFSQRAFCRTLLCENHEFRPLIPTFFTKTVLQNAFCANMQFRPLFSYFLTQTVLQNAFCANMQFRPLFPTFGLRMEGRGEAGCPAIPTGGGCGHRMIPHRLLWW